LELDTTRHEGELTGNETAERNLEHFAEGLGTVYASMARALKPGAPLVFTYHHNQQEAYLAVGIAILDAKLVCSASLPCPAEMGGSIHIHGTNSSIVDTVFVCRHRGLTPRAWLFDDADALAEIMARELAELRAAGMMPTTGDIRSIAQGHITRMAIWKLRPSWESTLNAKTKLNRFRTMMDAIATPDQIVERLERMKPPDSTMNYGLFAAQEERELVDAIAF